MNTQANITKFFYQNGKLVTLNVREQCSTVLRNRSQPLAVIKGADNTGHADLLVTDEKNTVFHIVNTAGDAPLSYLPYGYTSPLSSLLPLVGFNGEPLEVLTKSYPLGNGYRIYNPILMRFYAPDKLSPFAAGGLNPYMYCQGDPVGKIDPSGRIPVFLKPIQKFFKAIKKRILRRESRSAADHAATPPSATPPDVSTRVSPEPLNDPILQQLAWGDRHWKQVQHHHDITDAKYYDLTTAPPDTLQSRLHINNARLKESSRLTREYGLEPARPYISAMTYHSSSPPAQTKQIRHS
jgi:RHS repeat-associated protein